MSGALAMLTLIEEPDEMTLKTPLLVVCALYFELVATLEEALPVRQPQEMEGC
jgi:hypothetical protein